MAILYDIVMLFNVIGTIPSTIGLLTNLVVFQVIGNSLNGKY